MEEYTYEVVIRSVIRAYSPEHAKDRIDEILYNSFGKMNISNQYRALKIGDEITTLRSDLDIGDEIGKRVKTCLKELVKDIFKDIEVFTEKTLPIFDRTNYYEVREKLLEKMEKYTSGEGRSIVNHMAEVTGKQVSREIRDSISEAMIGGVKFPEEVTS